MPTPTVQMRRLAIILSGVVLFVVLLPILVATFFNVDHFRPKIESELQQALNRSVTLGRLHLRLLPLSVAVDGLTIQESPAFASGLPFAKAQEVYISAGLFSLLRGELDIRSITLQHPQVELIRSKSGVWNFADLGAGSSPSAPKSSSRSPGQLTLKNLKISDGQIAVTDRRTKALRTVYDHIDAAVTDFAWDRQFGLEVALHFPGQGKETISFSGKVGPVQPGNTFVAGRLSIQNVALSGLAAVANGTIPPRTDAVASGEATLQSVGDELRGKGALTLANPVVRGTRVAYPIEAQYDLSLYEKTDATSIRSGSVKIGPTVVSISGEVNSGVKPASLNIHAATKNASIAELLSLATLVGAASDSSTPIKGSLTADLAVRGSSANPIVTGDLSSSSLQAEDLVLTNVQSKVNMDNGVVRLSPVTAGVFGGQEAGDISLDTRGQHPLCHVKSRLIAVDANALLSGLSSLKDTLYGALAADGDLTFALDKGPNLARTLNGTLAFSVTNGHLKNVNILSELSKVGRFLGNAPAQSASGTALQRLSGTMNIQNGVANTNNLVAAMAEGSLSGMGSMNLASQTLDMRVMAVLSSGISNQVGGKGVGGFLNTALANNKGELVLPVVVTGTTAHPIFAPDVQAIAKMKFSQLLPTSGDPSTGLIGSILGGALGNKTGTKKDQHQLNSITSILDQFGQKKK